MTLGTALVIAAVCVLTAAITIWAPSALAAFVASFAAGMVGMALLLISTGEK